MPHLVNSVDIRRPVEEVFDYVSDLQNELEWNPNLTSIERLSSGPLGVGTRFAAKWRGSPPLTIQVTRFERPRVFEAFMAGKGMDGTFRAEFSPLGDGTHATVAMDSHLTGLMRLMSPVIGRALQRQEERNLANVKSRLERG